jgi:HlyD family secretion protein
MSAQAQVTPTGGDPGLQGRSLAGLAGDRSADAPGHRAHSLSYNPALRPGGFASARSIAGGFDCGQLPQSAIQSDTAGQFRLSSWATTTTGGAAARVTTGDVSENGVAIASGLNGTERVVLTAGAFLNPGQKVIPVLRSK